jgi:hypothetical protein
MARTLAIFGVLALAAVVVFIGQGRTGVVDMKKRDVLAIPSGAVPHGGKEKPVLDQPTTGCARQ